MYQCQKLGVKEKKNKNSKKNLGKITLVLKNFGTNPTQMDMVQALNNLTQVMTFVFTYGVANNNHETKHTFDNPNRSENKNSNGGCGW